MAKGKNISDSDRKIATKMMKEMTGEGPKNISELDKSRVREITGLHEKYLKRNDGGIARKTRVF